MIKKIVLCSIISISFSLFSSKSYSIPTIRDTEIENLIKDMSRPLLEAADLKPSSVKFYIVNDDQINAFVFGGSNIFINTGLIKLSDNPNMLLGVIAHEIGHIYQGHILSSSKEYKKAAVNNIITYALGIAAVASGSPEAATAIISGGSHINQRNLLAHSRVNEQEADKIALKILDEVGLKSNGLLDLFKYLSRFEATHRGKINPYVQTHPLSSERISFIKNSIENNHHTHKVNASDDIIRRFKFANIKLTAFLEDSQLTINKYKDDNSEIGLYAKAIAYYRKPDIEKSLYYANKLINLYPKNPFYHELKGQILFENGRGKEAIEFYDKANQLIPSSALILIELARSYMEKDTNESYKKAINYLNQAASLESDNIMIWHNLAICHGKLGNIGKSNLYIAEEYFLRGKDKDAKSFLSKALRNLEENSPAYLRAKDIENAISEKQKKENKDNKNNISSDKINNCNISLLL